MSETPQFLEAKEKLVTAMLYGCPWEAAARWAGVQTTRSTAYRWRHAYDARGEEALHDGRHGHPRTLREPARQWMEAYCRGAPQTPSRVVQAALVERFGVQVTVTHLNRVRAALGVGRRPAGGGKKTEETGLTEDDWQEGRGASYCWLRRRRRVCCPPCWRLCRCPAPRPRHACATSPPAAAAGS